MFSLLLFETSEISFLYCFIFRLFAREDSKHVVQIVGLREVQVDSVDVLLEVTSMFVIIFCLLQPDLLICEMCHLQRLLFVV